MDKRITIGVFIGNANSPHTKTLMRGIYNAAESKGADVIFYISYHMDFYANIFKGEKLEDSHDYQSNVVYDYAMLSNVDVLIINYGSLCIYMGESSIEGFLDKFKGIPYVVLEDRDESGRGSSIISDNYNGMSKLVEHLIAVHGYRRFTYLSGPLYNRDADERYQAFTDVMDKYGIDVEPDMVEIGDFSQNVAENVNRLLDAYPDMQAMVCANDIMADTAYKEIKKRGLKVGRDIAVTGYDDYDQAESMNPPLTTVKQNEFDMAYVSVEQAINLVKGKPKIEMRAPASLRIRVSCGCKKVSESAFKFNFDENTDGEEYIDKIVKAIALKAIQANADNVVRNTINQGLRALVVEYLDQYEEGNPDAYDRKKIFQQVNELIGGKYGDYVAPVALSEAMSTLIENRMKRENDLTKVRVLAQILSTIQSAIQSAFTIREGDFAERYEQNSCYIPLISRDMMDSIADSQAFYKAPMKILAALGCKSSYLFILDKPVRHKAGQKWIPPKKMYLASYHIGTHTVAYKPEDRPEIKKNKGILQQIGRDEWAAFTAYDLFIGEMQYGLLVCEVDPDDQILMFLASMQISQAMGYLTSYSKQMQMRTKLESLVEDVKEKNRILGFISENDQLTGCLNRRGFMEQAVNLMRENNGQKAYFILADLDHLKEINDCFGHAEGDFAIKSAARILKESLPKGVVVSRIGGDEFTAMGILADGCEVLSLSSMIRDYYTAFNETTGRPYYVELSVGICELECSPDKDINEYIKRADVLLYEAKRNRRASMKR